MDAIQNLYNLSSRAGSGPRDGFRHTEESKLKMSKATKGKPKPKGFGAKVSAWKTGRPNPKHSETLIGKPWSVDKWHSYALKHYA